MAMILQRVCSLPEDAHVLKVVIVVCIELRLRAECQSLQHPCNMAQLLAARVRVRGLEPAVADRDHRQHRSAHVRRSRAPRAQQRVDVGKGLWRQLLPAWEQLAPADEDIDGGGDEWADCSLRVPPSRNSRFFLRDMDELLFLEERDD